MLECMFLWVVASIVGTTIGWAIYHDIKGMAVQNQKRASQIKKYGAVIKRPKIRR